MEISHVLKDKVKKVRQVSKNTSPSLLVKFTKVTRIQGTETEIGLRKKKLEVSW